MSLTSVVNTIFGGSSKKEKSGNLNNEWMLENFGTSGAGAFNNALGGLQSTLGTGPQGFFDQGGGRFLLDQGLDALTSKFSSLGLTKSGAAMKGMEQFRSGLASTYLDNWLNHMTDLGKLGLGAGGLVADTGQFGEGKGSESSGGLGKFIGSLLAFASDRRLKIEVSQVGEFADGLPIVEFEYRRDLDPELPAGRFRGVIAQDVARLRPWALGPVRPDGHLTVNYLRLGDSA